MRRVFGSVLPAGPARRAGELAQLVDDEPEEKQLHGFRSVHHFGIEYTSIIILTYRFCNINIIILIIQD